MVRMSRRGTMLLAGLVVAVSAALLNLVIGPRYLQPLPIGAKFAVAAACCVLIGAVAIYSRSRTYRVAPRAQNTSR